MDTIVVANRSANIANIHENGLKVVEDLAATGSMSINQVGQFPFGNRTFLGEIAEILLYNRSLSDLEMSKVGVYLTEKYGLETAYMIPPAQVSGCIHVDGVPVADTQVVFKQPREERRISPTDSAGCYQFDDVVRGKRFGVSIRGPAIP